MKKRVVGGINAREYAQAVVMAWEKNHSSNRNKLSARGISLSVRPPQVCARERKTYAQESIDDRFISPPATTKKVRN